MDSFGFSSQESRLLHSLKTPAKVQDFLNTIPAHRPRTKDTCFSPRLVLRHRRANCMEGAMLAAAALRLHGFPPFVVDLEAAKHDLDHVIAVFRVGGKWGAVSKTNHAVLRYREPVYRDIRELVMSYFHEYTDDAGKKTLRRFSAPINLSRFDSRGWASSNEEVWYIPEFLADAAHTDILTRSQLQRLRRADPIEIQVGKMLEWK